PSAARRSERLLTLSSRPYEEVIFEGLLTVLDPDLVVRVDEAASRPGAPREIRGAQNWAKGAVSYSKGTLSAQPALVDGELGLVAAPGWTTVQSSSPHIQRRQDLTDRGRRRIRRGCRSSNWRCPTLEAALPQT